MIGVQVPVANLGWTDERVEILKKMWADGASCSAIASELGGITRNAVIGKVHRLGLSGRVRSATEPKPPRRFRKRKNPRPEELKAPRRVEELRSQALGGGPAVEEGPEQTDLMPDAPTSRACGLMDLSADTCRWPIGEPGNPAAFFCGEVPMVGKPYCGPHCARAFTAARGPANVSEAERARRARMARSGFGRAA